jgi:hypothetical protein
MGYRLIAAKRRKKLKNSSFAAFVLFLGHVGVFYPADSSLSQPPLKLSPFRSPTSLCQTGSIYQVNQSPLHESGTARDLRAASQCSGWPNFGCHAGEIQTFRRSWPLRF